MAHPGPHAPAADATPAATTALLQTYWGQAIEAVGSRPSAGEAPTHPDGNMTCCYLRPQE